MRGTVTICFGVSGVYNYSGFRFGAERSDWPQVAVCSLDDGAAFHHEKRHGSVVPNGHAASHNVSQYCGSADRFDNVAIYNAVLCGK